MAKKRKRKNQKRRTGNTSPAQRSPAARTERTTNQKVAAGTGVTLTAEVVDTAPSAEDTQLLTESLATLRAAGFSPRREVSFEDVAADSACGMSRFRRYPLMSLLGLRDLDEEQLFERVHYDQAAVQRTTPEDLLELVSAYARAAGTAEQIGHVNLMLDPGSTTSGSFRFTNGDRVNDVTFDLDADFGDEEAQMQIAADVSPEGYEPHVLFAGDTARPVVLWAPRGQDLSALESVLEESV